MTDRNQSLSSSFHDHYEFSSPSRSPTVSLNNDSLSHSLLLEHKNSNTQHQLSDNQIPSSSLQSSFQSDLEAFLSDETTPPISPLKRSSSNFIPTVTKPALISTPKETTTSLDASSLIIDEKGRYVHLVSPSDTLEGISLKYGVSVSDLKKSNRIFNFCDITIFKKLIIPLDPALYERYQKESQLFQQKEKERQEEILQYFIQQTQAEESIALQFLQSAHFNYERAIYRYQIENSTGSSLDVSMRPTLSFSVGYPQENNSSPYKAFNRYGVGDAFDL